MKRKPRKYAWRVCGGIRKVKRLFVMELQFKRRRAGLSPEQVDAILGSDLGFPKISEIEANPNLFSDAFCKNWDFLISNDYRIREALFDLDGEYLDDLVDRFLEKERNLDSAVEDFKDSGTLPSLIPHADLEECLWNLQNRGPTKIFSPNMISPYDYARSHVFSCIMYELQESDRRKGIPAVSESTLWMLATILVVIIILAGWFFRLFK